MSEHNRLISLASQNERLDLGSRGMSLLETDSSNLNYNEIQYAKIAELKKLNEEYLLKIELLERKRQGANLNFLYALIFAGLFLMLYGVAHKSYMTKKRLLENLKIKQLEIEEKSNLLELKNKESEQFAYVASHDLKAPLNTLISCINIIKDEIDSKLSEQSQQMASFMITSVNRMKTMIDSLLEHGRLGKDIKFEEVDLNELIQNLREDLSQLIKETNAILDVNYLPKVMGSSTELSLLFQNLITNGIKFSDKNQQPHITITYKSSRASQRYQISIKDNGIGIPKRRQDSVFKLFERAHGKDYEGSGIGLAHCQKIVKLHKGVIWFESQVGKGSIFHFTLPMKDWNQSKVPMSTIELYKETGS